MLGELSVIHLRVLTNLLQRTSHLRCQVSVCCKAVRRPNRTSTRTRRRWKVALASLDASAVRFEHFSQRQWCVAPHLDFSDREDGEKPMSRDPTMPPARQPISRDQALKTAISRNASSFGGELLVSNRNAVLRTILLAPCSERFGQIHFVRRCAVLIHNVISCVAQTDGRNQPT